MTGHRPDPSAARNRLASAQTRLLSALVAGAPVPPGFDPVRLRIQTDALIAKRREVAARIRPDLAEVAGVRFTALFDAYARAHPRPATGAGADADAFARTLPPPPPGSARAPRWISWARRARPRSGRRHATTASGSPPPPG